MISVGVNILFICLICDVNFGEWVYVIVCVINGVGFFVICSFDGMFLDVSFFFIGCVIDGNDIIGVDYNVVFEDWNVFMFWFGVEDVESGVWLCIWIIVDEDGSKIFKIDVSNNLNYG